ncbi:Six-bladed beta-propeller TolB-like protein [Penicillium digitatum]|uniref:Six-bladed beta-propeller TolB-like protein n=1 Tax=Penicillium digitatum TaxID=36651 RepID=A0A7T6XSB3_PENDI|nr:Six-bladed beta-propeller TolB-like protein [Penicillium digitatum]
MQPSVPAQPIWDRHFDDAEDTDGITELSLDIYTVVATNAVYTIDLKGHETTPELILIAKPPAGDLNDIAALDDGNAVVITDSQLGLLWRLDIRTGNYSVIHHDETMAANHDMGLLLGVNGWEIIDDYWYYTNSPKRIFVGFELIYTPVVLWGLVKLSAMIHGAMTCLHGVAFLADLVDSMVTRVFPNGSHEIIAGSTNSADLMTATLAAFGRTKKDRNVLYITTGGETRLPVNNTSTRGGKVMALSVEL